MKSSNTYVLICTPGWLNIYRLLVSCNSIGPIRAVGQVFNNVHTTQAIAKLQGML